MLGHSPSGGCHQSSHARAINQATPVTRPVSTILPKVYWPILPKEYWRVVGRSTTEFFLSFGPMWLKILGQPT